MCIINEKYMKRCFELAAKAGKDTLCNPKVGAVLVYENQIIGESYHKSFGDAHAEINCLKSVSMQNQDLIPKSTLYVSLEPCSHFGKTPPCVESIVQSGIKNVVVSAIDPNPIVSGNGIAYLQKHGIQTTVGVLKNEGIDLIHKFKINLQKQCYFILKWAQTSNGIMGVKDHPLKISLSSTDILTHTWRGEHDGIMIAKNTLSIDQPSLTVRHINGPNPRAIFVCPEASDLKKYTFNDLYKDALVLTIDENLPSGNLKKIIIQDSYNIEEISIALFRENIYSCIVEGGAKLLQSFIDKNAWHEARIIVNKKPYPIEHSNTILSPSFQHKYEKKMEVGEDTIYWFRNRN
jgi:diaminohydroxyphosphoribosylaminopyrimidine deaminase/5-amino-6-(5-phosphoribosylamino)uracil reductase